MAKNNADLNFHLIDRKVLGGPGYKAPSDTLNIAPIGCGGMGGEVFGHLLDENIVALCDVDFNNAIWTVNRRPKAPRYADFRVMLEKHPEIDAVVICIPDHMHTYASVIAMRMGKHCFTQKPLTRTVGEARMMTEVAKETGLTTQMGNQGHAEEGCRIAREAYEAGWIGEVQEVHIWTDRPIWPQAIERPTDAYHTPSTLDWDLWLGTAPERPYHPAYHPFAWRGFWDFGTGALGDIACHSMDSPFWSLDLRSPKKISAESSPLFEDSAPAMSRIEYHFDAIEKRGPVKMVWYDGNFKPHKPEHIGEDDYWAGGGQMWVGTKGTLVPGGEDGITLYPNSLHQEYLANKPAEVYPRTDGVYLEFIQACKAGIQAGSNFADHAGPLTEMALLGNLALRTQSEITWDPVAFKTDNEDANALIQPTYRAGWEL